MTDEQFETIAVHMRAAYLGEPVPSIRSGDLPDLMAALKSPLDERNSIKERSAALAKIGLATVSMMLLRTTTGLVAERELALLRNGRTDA